ncbi:hypothetical protein EDD15DRAFT_2319601 [Pisolithus albus]|nr:hypothetical protein EDD15DRAFT_2319601 [Pisolithus albus]
MAKKLDDLETFWRAVFQMKSWEHDHSRMVSLSWREVHLPLDRPIRRFVGRWRRCTLTGTFEGTEDGVLAKDDLEIDTLYSPHPYERLQNTPQLLFADGTPALHALRLPRFVMKNIRVIQFYAGLAENSREKTIQECHTNL